MLLRQRDECPNAPLVCQHAEYRGIANAGALIDESSEVRASALNFGMHAPCANEQRATIFGEEHSSRAALEQLDAKLGFELSNGA